MKYLVKYIPVQEKITEGYCLDTNTDEIVYYNGDYGEATPSNLRKVKFFLCNADVQVGDTVFDEDGLEQILEKIDEDNLAHTTLGKTHLHNLFKKVGIISPNALSYIHAGQLLNDLDIKFIYRKEFNCMCEKPNVYRSKEQQECKHMVDDHRGGDICLRQIEVVDYIEIKGPCGHFH